MERGSAAGWHKCSDANCPEVAGSNAGHIMVSLLVNNHLPIFVALCYLEVI